LLYIVANPPFIGTKKVRETLGDEYTNALRKNYSGLPETIDYVMYWWHQGASLLSSSNILGFGLITTNSLRQIENRKVIQNHIKAKDFIRISFAIADHPWSDGGASVRIGMTACHRVEKIGKLGEVIQEVKGETPEDAADCIKIKYSFGEILDDLRIGARVTTTTSLKSNLGLCNQGCKLVQRRRKSGEDWEQGFLIREETAIELGLNDQDSSIIKPYITGDDITGKSRDSFVIDFHGLTMKESELINPRAYQKILEEVKPFRDQNNMKRRRENWWTFGAPASRMRKTTQDIFRYIITSEVSKHRVFVFEESSTLADGSCFVFGFSDAYYLGDF
jgi:hypothetical protein